MKRPKKPRAPSPMTHSRERAEHAGGHVTDANYTRGQRYSDRAIKRQHRTRRYKR